MTDILEQQEENKPKKAVKSSLQKYEMEQEKKVGVNMYNPDNLTGDEQKIISSMLQRASLFTKEKSDADEEDSDWVYIFIIFKDGFDVKFVLKK